MNEKNRVLRVNVLLIKMDSETKLCQGKDVFEKMNYLYQASYMIVARNRVAASYYGNIMMGSARKAVLRVDSSVKRTICKQCQSPLIPGETARVRLMSRPTKAVKWTCLICMNSRKYPTKRGFKLWNEQPEAVLQVLDYTPKLRSQNEKKQNSEEMTETAQKRMKGKGKAGS